MNLIKSTRFLSNFVSIASANLVSQAILLVATPVLTRIYTPENFGVAALFTTSLSLTGSISAWRFDRTIPNARSRLSALFLCCWGFLFVIFSCVLVSLAIYVDMTYTNAWNGTKVLGGLLYFLPFAILFTGGVQIAAGWYARASDLRPFSRSIMMYTILYILVAMLAGLLHMPSRGLILASVVALFAQLATLIFFFKYPVIPKGRYSSLRFFSSFRQHVSVATTATGVTFVNTLSLTAPIFLLAQIYAVADIGIYALMTRLITTPLGVLTKSLSISFWSRAAELGRENRYKDLYLLYKRVCMVMAVPALLVVFFCLLGSQMIVPVLGSQWQDAGPVLVAITPYLIGLSIASPTNHLWVIKKQSYQYIADGTRLFLMVIFTIAAYRLDWSFSIAVFFLSLSSLIGHIILIAIHIVSHKLLIRGQISNLTSSK